MRAWSCPGLSPIYSLHEECDKRSQNSNPDERYMTAVPLMAILQSETEEVPNQYYDLSEMLDYFSVVTIICLH